jgi:hypothetical protein
MIKSVKLLIGANAYACIEKVNGGRCDFLLSPGKHPAKSLRETAEEYAEKAENYAMLAKLANEAADKIHADSAVRANFKTYR